MQLGEIQGLKSEKVRKGIWTLDDDDFWLATLLCDPVYGPELLWDDPPNHEYGGCYRVRDYQYPLFRSRNNYQGHACARSVGKTESIKAKAFTHAFRRHGQAMLLTAPELIHLLPLTDAVESRIRDCRLTDALLDKRSGKTGFAHRPFEVDFIDGTKIFGRIPRLSGTGVKGMHQPDLIVDEAQDYPEKGWIEVHETVMKDTLDSEGNPDFHYEFYGVHSGNRTSGFYSRSQQSAFKIIQITAIQRPGWGFQEKDAAKAAYGSTSSPDYRRNILGEPGSAASVFFVLARLAACTDDNRESAYNTLEYRHVEMQSEQHDELGIPMIEALDLPTGYKHIWAGMDLGLTISPTVISLFSQEIVTDEKTRAKHERMKLIRRITMYRFRQRDIVAAWLAIGNTYKGALEGFGVDCTGLGFPIMQAMEDDQAASEHLINVTRGYFFNAKVPVNVKPEDITTGQNGILLDRYGNTVKEEHNPLTGMRRFVTYQMMIEASTRYIRDWVDHTYLMLPFDPDIHRDMMGETQQRVRTVGELKRKPVAFHILDSFRAAAMVSQRDDIEAELAAPAPPVFDTTLDAVGGMRSGQELGVYG